MLIDLEAACRAVCADCLFGEPPTLNACGDWVHTGRRIYEHGCAADALRKLAAEEGVTTAGAAVGAIMAAMEEEAERQG